MEPLVIERDGERLVECVSAIPSGEDGISLVTACIENGTHRVLIESARLPAEFLDLKTGVAGAILQKLQNYHLRAALVFPPTVEHHGRFAELVNEAKRGGDFRVFTDRAEAETWLLSS